jgi:hypothetical protein
VVLTGRLECGRMTGRWRHVSRVETEAGRFEMRRDEGRGPGERGMNQ